VGGFPDRVIMDEDVLLCARLLRAGGSVAYCAEAMVWHGHSYTLRQHLQRYFDIGAFVSQAGQELDGAHTGREGLRYLRAQSSALARQRAWGAVGRGLVEAAAKWVGFQLGVCQRVLPTGIKRRLSLHAAFWREEHV